MMVGRGGRFKILVGEWRFVHVVYVQGVLYCVGRRGLL